MVRSRVNSHFFPTFWGWSSWCLFLSWTSTKWWKFIRDHTMLLKFSCSITNNLKTLHFSSSLSKQFSPHQKSPVKLHKSTCQTTFSITKHVKIHLPNYPSKTHVKLTQDDPFFTHVSSKSKPTSNPENRRNSLGTPQNRFPQFRDRPSTRDFLVIFLVTGWMRDERKSLMEGLLGVVRGWVLVLSVLVVVWVDWIRLEKGLRS